MRVAVIGAGPSGLVTLKYLLEAHKHLGMEPIEAKCFEKEADIGGTFFARTYEDAEMVSSKQLTTFSDFRPCDDDADFLSIDRYIEYLHQYCTQFQLWQAIRLSTAVLSITRGGKGGHTIAYQSGDAADTRTWECDAVAVCSGLHLTPNIPHILGIENVPKVMHSAEFKSRKQFGIGKTIHVIGSGETGADIAYLAVTSHTQRVVMSHRDGFHLAAKVCKVLSVEGSLLIIFFDG
ncbi:MAG: hypothetical protein M1821_002899 [Bathelium mastoideum]|nr:MAG: hypothetical protein M1821_002899 [Bathelium mastoideum]